MQKRQLLPKEYVLCLNKSMISKSDNLNVEFKEFNKQEYGETILTIAKRASDYNSTSSFANDSLFTVFKDKQRSKSSEKFQFTHKFFIDSQTKKYCYIYNFILD